MTFPLFTLGLELSSGSYTDVTSYCTRASFDRALYDAFSPLGADSALFELMNDVGSFSPLLNRNLVLGSRVHLAVQDRDLFLDYVGSGHYSTAVADRGAGVSGTKLEIILELGSASGEYNIPTAMPIVQQWPGSWRLSDYAQQVVFEWVEESTAVNTIALQLPTGFPLVPGGGIGIYSWAQHLMSTLGPALDGVGALGPFMHLFMRVNFNYAGGAGALAVHVSSDYRPGEGLGNGTWTLVKSDYNVTGNTGIKASTDFVRVTAAQTETPGGIDLHYVSVAPGSAQLPVLVFDPNHGTNADINATRFGNPDPSANWSLTGDAGTLSARVTSYDLFHGRLRSLSTRPALQERTTVLEALTEVDALQRRLLRSPMLVNISANSLFTEIATRSLVSSWNSDLLTDVANFVAYDDHVAANAIQQFISSGLYKTYVDGAGTLQLKGRFWGEFGATLTSTIIDQPLDLNYSVARDGIINRASISATPRKQLADVSTLAWVTDPIPISSGKAAGFFIAYLDPRNAIDYTIAGSLAAQVASQDYYASPNSDGTGTALTNNLSISMVSFAQTAVASIYNNGVSGDLYLTRFQVRGFPLLTYPPVQSRTDDSSSQARYGVMDKIFDNVLFTDFNTVRDISATIVQDRAEPRDQISMTLVNDWPATLSRQVGDVQSVINSLSGVNSIWSIKRMRHEISLISGLEHTVRYDLERATVRPYIILDHATFGLLDGTRQLAL